MVLNTEREDITQRIVSKKKLFVTLFLGIILLVIPVVLIYFNPVFYVVEQKLRLENGSMFHELLLRRFISTKYYMYLFNITNAERFLSGADEKIHLEEIGPFVYQEFRINEDLEINKDPGIMRYIPKVEPVFIPEESIGDPKDIMVNVPNIVMLAITSLVSKYSFLVRQVFNLIAASSRAKAIVTVTAYDQMWGYPDPLVKLANNAIPGIIYFKSAGLFERYYDFNYDFRLELGTTDLDKFSVKKATRLPSKNNGTPSAFDNLSESTYNDAYEGAVFPPNLSPDRPISIFRQGFCKTFPLQYQKSKKMAYGGDAFVYQFHNETFKDRQQCNSKGWCPDGLKNVADCYFGIPAAFSKGHFLDSDPRLLDMVEGLKPNRTIHDTHIFIDPKIGVSVGCSISLQMSLVLADVGYNSATKRFKDTIVPVSHVILKSPPMLDEVKSVLDLMYSQGPYIVLSVQVVCSFLGILFLLLSAKMMYWIRQSWKLIEREKYYKQTQMPLMMS